MNDGTTHWEGCEREHHECALAMLERMRGAAQAHDERVRSEERERAVSIVLDEVDGAEEERGCDSMLGRIAAAIRARGEEKP